MTEEEETKLKPKPDLHCDPNLISHGKQILGPWRAHPPKANSQKSTEKRRDKKASMRLKNFMERKYESGVPWRGFLNRSPWRGNQSQRGMRQWVWEKRREGDWAWEKRRAHSLVANPQKSTEKRWDDKASVRLKKFMERKSGVPWRGFFNQSPWRGNQSQKGTRQWAWEKRRKGVWAWEKMRENKVWERKKIFIFYVYNHEQCHMVNFSLKFSAYDGSKSLT